MIVRVGDVGCTYECAQSPIDTPIINIVIRTIKLYESLGGKL